MIVKSLLFYGGFLFVYYPDYEVVVSLFPIFFIALCVLVTSIFSKRVRSRVKIVLVSASYVVAYIVTGFALHIPRSQVEGRGPFLNQLVDATGFPFVTLTHDSGNTDPSVHMWALLANLVMYFFVAFFILWKLKNHRFFPQKSIDKRGKA